MTTFYAMCGRFIEEEPITIDAYANVYDSGVAWVHRGLWCGLRRRAKSDKKPEWFCRESHDLFDGRLRTAEALTHLFQLRLSQLPRVFPGTLVRAVLPFVDHSTLGADGVPFAIHKIEDRNIRRTTLSSFRQNR